ncbi:MAG TPA: hypothetical protein HPP56_10515 [Nitrospirae bacterium]|nr:hypothetical protein [Nitrospirota bacterium]
MSESNQDSENWRLIVRSEEGNEYFINPNSINNTNPFTVFAWYKIVPTKKSGLFDRLKELRFFGGEIAGASYYKIYAEIDCRRSFIRILITQAYSFDNKILRREETLTGQWAAIPTASSFDMIREIICKQ